MQMQTILTPFGSLCASQKIGANCLSKSYTTSQTSSLS